LSRAENFQKLIEERPADALKYVEELEGNPFWKHCQAKLQKELDACDVNLRSCALEKVEFIRGYRKGIQYKANMPAYFIKDLKEEIALQKEAEKVEDARKPAE